MKRPMQRTAPILLSLLTGSLVAECADAGICRLAPHHFDNSENTMNSWTAAISFGIAQGSRSTSVVYQTITPRIGWHTTTVLRLSAELPVVDLLGPSGEERGISWGKVATALSLAMRLMGVAEAWQLSLVYHNTCSSHQ